MHLKWFRDRGRGQEAADATGAQQTVDIWPVAILPIPPDQEANEHSTKIDGTMWGMLYRGFGVNAILYV